jgi:hypothetical protein
VEEGAPGRHPAGAIIIAVIMIVLMGMIMIRVKA